MLPLPGFRWWERVVDWSWVGQFVKRAPKKLGRQSFMTETNERLVVKLDKRSPAASPCELTRDA